MRFFGSIYLYIIGLLIICDVATLKVFPDYGFWSLVLGSMICYIAGRIYKK